jgi:MFS family permease
MGDQTGEMLRALTRDAIVVAAVIGSLMLAIFLLIRSRLAAHDDDRPPSRLPIASVSLLLIVGVAGLGALILRDFNRSLEPELDRRASLIGEMIRADTERAVVLGIPVNELVGVEEYFDLFLEEFPELDYVALYDDRGRTVAIATEILSHESEADDAPDPSEFDPTAVRSVVHGFEIGPTSGSVGSVELGVDPGYIRSKLSNLGLDVVVILIVAIVIALEVTLAISSRFTDRRMREPRPRRRPADARLVLFVFVIAEELNKSFLPIFIKAANNPTGLDTNLAISLPIVAFLLAVAVTSPWAGRIVLVVGQRRLFLGGLAAAALSHLGMIFAGNVLQIVGLRTLTGFGYAVATIACMEYLLERLSPGNRSRSVGVFVTVVMGGTFAGTALGGIFADRLGYDAVFIISFGLVVLAGISAVSLLEPGSQLTGTDDSSFGLRDIAAVAQQPPLAALLVGVTIPMNVLMAAFLWYLVPLTLDSLGSNASVIARTLMLYYLMILVGGPILERLNRWIRNRSLLGAGSVLSGTVLLLPAAAPNTLTILFAVLVVGIGHAAIRGPQVALAMDLAERSVPGSGRGAILAAMRSLERLGSLVGLIAIAVIASRFSLAVAISTVGISTALAGVGFLAAGPILSRKSVDA